ncbi:tRNA (adenosine(37)-N6)-threonylcarbamoyltransferase complex dimerization subunit type 1 TsaB [Pusillimonas sp. TS35]|uniref:tRNA (adenosine(37)-N6)-threonylcarbamoyltransferase complex dimerization subunit type 1 TsaB n=1 Tax=Paracandidimonas lactea TaxID=2895524 RepID=UPI00136FA810|nr:tRNA (adenosine(37)-N6)-threonylcarbamoyltransferase complex dimerization subunit type 1 TsaB [Paracandidimonas lactea]MYN13657.1 tRNA (adenosine(37)-N6)-threonylcarbamoyltransferase complex dimerization subunit type 1 TsaB [Pusillimonas sp. TS35]
MTIHILALETSSSLCGVGLLSVDTGAPTLRVLEHDATGEHAERLLPMADQLLAQAGVGRGALRAVAFGQGPGGFTGLRVACGVAQGIALALGIPVIPVPSLLAAAARAAGAADAGVLPAAMCGPQAPIYVAVQDARMEEVYLAAYSLVPAPAPASAAGSAVVHGAEGCTATEWLAVQPPVLVAVRDVAVWLDRSRHALGRPMHLLGDALQAYPLLAALHQSRPWLTIGPPVRADAAAVASLALGDWHAGRLTPADQAAPLYVRDKVAFTTAEREHGAGGNPRAAALDDGIVLLAMGEAHLDAVADIERAVQSYPWTRGNFADGLKAGYSAWVAEQGGEVVGFAMVMLAPDIAHLLVIAVRPDSQRHGAGGMLLAQCEQEARENGLASVLLEVRPSNTNAVRFYSARGYHTIATRKAYYPAGHGRREDAYLMEKRLDAEAAS